VLQKTKNNEIYRHQFSAFQFSVLGQTRISKELTYSEFLGYVKKYHPIVKSANLQISSAQANLMMARGGFDPKIEVDFEKNNSKTKNIIRY